MPATTHQIQQTHTYSIIECGHVGCGVYFGLDDGFIRARKEDHATFYCPNGHPRWWPPGSSDAEKERKKRISAEEEATRVRAQLDQVRASNATLRRSRSALKGEVTKARKRAARTQCPVADCKRTFAPTNMQRHVEVEHPHWHPEPALEQP